MTSDICKNKNNLCQCHQNQASNPNRVTTTCTLNTNSTLKLVVSAIDGDRSLNSKVRKCTSGAHYARLRSVRVAQWNVVLSNCIVQYAHIPRHMALVQQASKSTYSTASTRTDSKQSKVRTRELVLGHGYALEL